MLSLESCGKSQEQQTDWRREWDSNPRYAYAYTCASNPLVHGIAKGIRDLFLARSGAAPRGHADLRECHEHVGVPASVSGPHSFAKAQVWPAYRLSSSSATRQRPGIRDVAAGETAAMSNDGARLPRFVGAAPRGRPDARGRAS